MKTFQVGVVGAGHWGPNLIRNFMRDPRTKVKWVCDADTSRLAAIKGHFESINVTPHVDDIFNDSETDAVIISTPTVTHYALAKKALEKGKHIFVEKPLATSFSEASELSELANAKNLKLMVGHVFLFNPAIRKIREIVSAGELGKIHYSYSVRTNLGPIRGDVNALWDLAPHDISILMYVFNEVPINCEGFGQSFINSPNEDVVFGKLRFPSGAFSSLHVSWLDPRKVRQFVIVGDKKMLVFDDMVAEKLVVYNKSVEPSPSPLTISDTLHLFRKSIREGEVSTIPIADEEPLMNECVAFIEAISEGKSHPSDGKFGANVVRVLEEITLSMRR